jgi:TetR/AcrR family transcriptional regulator, mexJK operon transcriptional repressor
MRGSPGLAIETAERESRCGRPSAGRAVEIEETIRVSALEQFLDSGFEAASMDAIASAAKVSKGTLYARYESKEALFRTVLEAELKNLSRGAGAHDHLLSDDLEQRLRQHNRSLVASTNTGEFDRIRRLIASAQVTFPDMARLWHEIGIGRYVEFLAEAMAAHARVPEAARIDWTFYANLLLHALGGWQQAERLVRSVSDDEVIAFGDAVIDTIVKSLPPRG